VTLDRRLATARLVLRPLTLDDLDALFAIGKDPEVVRYTGRPPEASIDDTRTRHERIATSLDDGSGIRWGIVRDGEVVGTAGIFRWDPKHQQAQLGYDLARAHWGQGLMTEALGAVLDDAFVRFELHRVDAHVDPDNVASTRVLAKLGFVAEGRTRESFRFPDGHFGDTLVYGLLRGDWR